MKWIKERVFAYHREDARYIDTAHLLFLRLRSDGQMFYKVERIKAFSHTAIEQFFVHMLTFHDPIAASVSLEKFDVYFDELRAKNHGKEIDQDELLCIEPFTDTE